MKLIINAAATRPAILTVVNGDDVIVEYDVYGPDVEATIDRIFKERYIEAVQFVEHGAYAERFISYIANKYQGVEVI